MTAKTKLSFSQLTTPELNAKGRDLMAARGYREAIQVYKQLYKREPNAGWKSLLVDAYLGRAKELAGKKMYKEAVLLWENMIALDETVASQDLYIDWLIQAGQTSKAVAAFVNLRADDSAQCKRLESLFATLMLAGDQATLTALPTDSELKRHYAIAQSALQSYCEGADIDRVREQLQGITFRSPYKDFRQILTALLQREAGDPTAARELLARISEDSPFFSLRDAIWPSLVDSPSRAEALERLNHHQREFAAGLLGLDKRRLKLLQQWLASRQQTTAKALHQFIVAHRDALDEEQVRRTCLSLFSHYPQSRTTYRRLFGPVPPFEDAKASALQAEQKGDLYRAETHWLRCVELLRENTTDPDNALKAALILRHITDPLVKEVLKYGEQPSPILLKYLETSLELDPTDKATYLNLIALYGKTRHRKVYQQWVDKAITRFPDDNQVLMAAIEAAKGKGAFKKAASYATTLLQRDPINKQARNLLIDAHLAHARKSIKARKYHLAEKELDAADQLARERDGMIEINRGLLALSQKQQASAAHWLKQGVALSDSLLTATLRLQVEAERLSIAPHGLQTYVSELDQRIVSSDQVMAFVKLINHYLEEKCKLRSVLDTLAKQLRAAAQNLTTEATLQALCDCLARVPHYPLLEDCASIALSHWPNQPLFVYYQAYGRANGKIYNVSDEDFHRLEEAAEQAHDVRDVRTAMRIDEFLNQGMGMGLPPMPGGSGPIPQPLQDIFQEIENLPPAERASAMRELIAQLAAATGTQPPPELLERINDMAGEDNVDGPPFSLPWDDPFPAPFPFDALPKPNRKKNKRKQKRRR